MEPTHRKNQRSRLRDHSFTLPDDHVTIDNANNFIKHNLADCSVADTSNWGQWTTNLATNSSWTSGFNDTMDTNLLPFGLQNLIEPGLPLTHVSPWLAPSGNSVQASLTSPGFVYPGSLSSQVDYSMGASTDCSTNYNYGPNNSGFYQGTLLDVISMATSGSARYINGKSSPVCMKQVDRELVTSPEQISSITACSNGDAFSDAEMFDSGATLCDSYLQYTTNSSAEKYIEPNRLYQGMLPNQFVAPETSMVPKLSGLLPNGDGRSTNDGSVYLSNHQILNEYIMYQSMPEIMKRNISFLHYMHSTACAGHWCNCDHYSLLVSHFNTCYTANCNICGPVRQNCGTNKRPIRDNDRLGTFYSEDSNNTCNDTLADVIRPFKRLKNENQKIEHLPQLEQWPETPPCSVEVFEVTNLLSPAEYPRITGVAKEDIMSGTEIKIPSIVQPIVNDQQEPTELASTSNLMDINVNHSAELSTRSSDISFKNPIDDLYEEAMQVRSEANQDKLEANCSAILPPAGSDSKLGFEETKNQGGTLADVFTAAQLKEHLLSFCPLNCEAVTGEANSSDGQNTCQLCAKDKLVFGPAPLYCLACGNRIKRNLIYHSSLDEVGGRLSFCTTCFKGSRGPNILFRGISVSKANLKKVKNDEETEDSWVQCDKCQCWQHRVCGLYNDKRDAEGKAEYICPRCCLDEIESGGHPGVSVGAAFGAKNLPTTKLSDHLEQRLSRRLEQEREEMANHLRKNLNEVEVAADLVIRVVACVDKRLEVKKEFLDIFHEEDYPAEFEYRSKVIFLFQKIEGIDVCLFGMCVQEFGSECSSPNNRCVYISYLDSVKYFRPERATVTGESLRTFVYHEILVGYLEYCKKRGFTTCYIWACPLIKGEDYIFYCHPETQKTPKQDKLRQWYKSMLKKAANDGVVVDYTNLYDAFFVPTNNKITAARLPYFEGDFWSGAAEDVVRKIALEESGGGLQRKLPTMRTLKAMGHDTPSTDATKDVLVMQKLGQTILPSKENFLIAHLYITCTHCHEVILSGSRWFCSHCKKVQLCSRCFNTDQRLNARKMHACNCSDKNILSEVLVNDVPLHTKDEDVLLETTFFETREAFLSHCQKDNYQFDSLAHAKYSSMMILYNFTRKLSNRGSTCDICKGDVLSKQYWHCSICPMFRICESCYQTKGGSCHTHNLSRPSIVAVCETKKKQLAVDEMAKAILILDELIHATNCESKACPNTKCVKLKRLFHHATVCKVRSQGGCTHCRKVWLMLRGHSNICSDSDCKVPRCLDLKKFRRAAQQQEAALQSPANP